MRVQGGGGALFDTLVVFDNFPSLPSTPFTGDRIGVAEVHVDGMTSFPLWQWIVDAIAQLIAAVRNAAAGIVGKVLGTFGLTMVTFDSVLPNLKAFVMSKISGMPADALAMLGYIGVGEAMSMILSALTIRLAWKVFIVPKSVADSLGAPST